MDGILQLFDLNLQDFNMILLCAILFVVFWKVMERWVFHPFLELVEAREAATKGAQQGAEDLRSRRESLESEYANKLLEARIAAMEQKMETLAQAREDEAKILDDGEGEAQEIVRNVRWEMEKNKGAFREELFREVDTLVDSMVSQLKKPPSGIEK